MARALLFSRKPSVLIFIVHLAPVSARVWGLVLLNKFSGIARLEGIILAASWLAGTGSFQSVTRSMNWRRAVGL